MKIKLTIKIALEHLTEVLPPLGYQLVADNYNVKISNHECRYSVDIYDNLITLDDAVIRLEEVEQIFEQCFPSVVPGTSYTLRIPTKDSSSLLRWNNLYTPEAVHEACKELVQYIVGDEVKNFIAAYRYLPDLLRKLDEEWSKHISYWSYSSSSVMIFASFDIRRVIISRLCNDPDYERKLTKAEYIANKNDKLESFLRIKELLATIEPRYSLE